MDKKVAVRIYPGNFVGGQPVPLKDTKELGRELVGALRSEGVEIVRSVKEADVVFVLDLRCECCGWSAGSWGRKAEFLGRVGERRNDELRPIERGRVVRFSSIAVRNGCGDRVKVTDIKQFIRLTLEERRLRTRLWAIMVPSD